MQQFAALPLLVCVKTSALSSHALFTSSNTSLPDRRVRFQLSRPSPVPAVAVYTEICVSKHTLDGILIFCLVLMASSCGITCVSVVVGGELALRWMEQ